MIQLQREDFIEHLNEQLDLLQAHCKSFDEGLYAQAKPISASLRQLLYDGNSNSKSILGRLGMKDYYFLSTSGIYGASNIGNFSGLTMVKMSTGGGGTAEYVPYLNDAPHQLRRLTFDKWWNEIIFYIKPDGILTRGNLIGEMRDTDGGGHVDSKLKKTYGNIVKNNSMGLVGENDNGKFELNGVERASMRQIAHEILTMFRHNGETMIEELENIKNRAIKIERNELCPCRSGKKNKHCHGKYNS